MGEFVAFSSTSFNRILRGWRGNEFSALHVTCGPLQVFAECPTNEQQMNFITVERGQVSAGSFTFYDVKYFLFRCLYGIITIHGLSNLEWDAADEQHSSLISKDIRLIEAYRPNMMVQMQVLENEELIILNLWSYAYMRIAPITTTNRHRNFAAIYHHREVCEIPTMEDEVTLPASEDLGLELGFVPDVDADPN